MHGLGLCHHRPGERVIERAGTARSQRLLHDDVDHSAILGVDADQRAQFGSPLHELEDGGIVDHQDIGIGHEDLEAGDSLGDHGVHVVQPDVVGAEVGDGHVQRVVDAGFALGFGAPGLEGLHHGMAHGLQGEVDDGSGATDGRGARSPLVVVRADRAAEGHIEMGMHIDAARQNQQARRIDDCMSRRIDCRRDARNFFALDQHVGQG
jgi:hypothetical protein